MENAGIAILTFPARVLIDLSVEIKPKDQIFGHRLMVQYYNLFAFGALPVERANADEFKHDM